MTIRKALLAAGLALSAAIPVQASANDTRAGEIAKQLNDPATQYAVAGMLSAMSKAILSMEIAPFVKAMERVPGAPARDIPPDATVGDLAGTSHDEMRDRLIEHVPAMMAAMGGMAGAFDEMMPELEAMAEKMKDAMPRR